MNSQAARTITNSVYSDLKDRIISCRFAPGTKLNIQSLCKEFDVSLGAMREALSKLSAEGLVDAFAQRGYAVSNVSESDLIELTEARIQVEKECLRRAIANGDLDWEAGIVGSLHRLNGLGHVDKTSGMLDPNWARAHADFHAALVAACGNRWLMRMRQQLYEQSERYRQLSVPLAVKHRDVVEEHKALADAVVARKAELSGALIGEHLMKTTSVILSALNLGDRDEKAGA